MEKKARFATLAVHAGQKPDPSTGAIMTPVYQSSTYVQSSPGVFKDGYDYGRTKNPTRTALEENLAALEYGKYGLCFSSGCAALDCVLHSLAAGDHVVLCDDVYGGTFRLFKRVFEQLGIEFSLVNMCDLRATEAAIRKNTKMLWVETPTNPMLKIINLSAIADLANKHKILACVDNTFASPYLQNPLLLGCHLVSHSSTKYIGGHSDVIGGALILDDDALAEKLRFYQNAVGAIPGPMDCFMLLRSTKTLHLRMQAHCQNAIQVASFLEAHPKIERVIYPGLESHPQHRLAATQMRAFGGMISLVLKGGLSAARNLLERVRLFSLAESLGGVESLIEHPAIMTHASIPNENRLKLGIVDGLVRLSVGVEDPQDLIEDLKEALNP